MPFTTQTAMPINDIAYLVREQYQAMSDWLKRDPNCWPYKITGHSIQTMRGQGSDRVTAGEVFFYFFHVRFSLLISRVSPAKSRVKLQVHGKSPFMETTFSNSEIRFQMKKLLSSSGNELRNYIIASM